MEEAEDIVQEVFAMFWEKGFNYDSEQKLRSLLYRSVHNKAIDNIRHKQVFQNCKQQISQHLTEVLSDEEYAQEDIYRQLFEVIDALPEKQHEVITLSISGLTLKQVAELLNISHETARTHKKRAMATLREKLPKDALLLVPLLSL